MTWKPMNRGLLILSIISKTVAWSTYHQMSHYLIISTFWRGPLVHICFQYKGTCITLHIQPCKFRWHGWLVRRCGSLVLNNFTTLDQLWRTNQRWWSYRDQWCHCRKSFESSSHSRRRTATAEIHKGYGLWAQREFVYRVVQTNEEIDRYILASKFFWPFEQNGERHVS